MKEWMNLFFNKKKTDFITERTNDQTSKLNEQTNKWTSERVKHWQKYL